MNTLKSTPQPSATTRPSSGQFWTAYLNYSSYDAPKVWTKIGGGIGLEYGPKEANSCAARVSYGLNYGGAPIGVFGGASRNLTDHTYNGVQGDGKRYIVSAAQMKKYLTDRWGKPPTKHTPTTTSELAAIIAGMRSDQCAIFATSGHTGVLKLGYGDPYVDDYLPVSVWLLL